MSGWPTRAASVAATAAPRSGSSTPTATTYPPVRSGEIFCGAPATRRHLPRRRASDPDDRGRLRVRTATWGALDADGFLYLADRRVDLIISGGANVFPAEVEVALIDHPKVADVVVIGLPDPEWGKRVHAVIAPADPADPPILDEVKTFMKSRVLAYKVPKTIEIVDAIPRSEAMKVNRGRMIDERS